ncbi:MAG TPA: NAD(+)/NADH kinase [Thermoplasmata archaeon]|nr:NAD(+)/NADH kinase [Thermoplasmata archaeon]
MRFGITANPHIPDSLGATQRILRFLEPKHEVLLETEIAKDVGRTGMPLAHMKPDIILAIGGDGTILRALQLVDADVLGINSGSLGFLAEVYANEVENFLGRILAKDYKVEERLRLKVTVDGQRLFDCLNEAVVHTAQVAKIRHFAVDLDGAPVTQVRADAMVLATPTGSTSYSMSVGGPIVDPRVRAIIATAIAPFKPSYRPHVFPAASQVRVTLVKPKECVLVMDGQRETHLKGTEQVVVTASEKPARFIRFRDDFYKRFEEKISRQ